jgi:hypothetical protein
MLEEGGDVSEPLDVATGRFWPILLKKIGFDSTAEKYVPKIKIRVLRRSFSTQI